MVALRITESGSFRDAQCGSFTYNLVWQFYKLQRVEVLPITQDGSFAYETQGGSFTYNTGWQFCV